MYVPSISSTHSLPIPYSSKMSTTPTIPTSFSSNYHLIFTFIAFLLSSLIFLLTHKKIKSKTPNLPPSPPGWPLVGNLFQISRSGKDFFGYLTDVKSQYGSIFTLRLGTVKMIVITDSKLVHEALIQKGAIFATRPKENPTRNIFSANKFTVNAAVYGPVWKSLRRNMVQNMLSSTRLKEFRDVRNNAMDKLIKRLRSEAEKNNGVVWVLKDARFAFFCILVAMCFGLELEEEKLEKIDQIMKNVLITVDPRIDDYLPILSPFFSKQRKKALEVRKEQVEFIVNLIEQRKRAIENPGSDHTATTFSYLDTLFDLKVDGKKSGPSDVELVSLCSEFLNGGTDTTATTVEWGMAELIANPEIQKKLFTEIKEKIGNKKIEENDIEKMVYLQAVVKETLRKHPPAHFTLTHAVTEPTTLGGYDIPTDANIEIYVPAIGEDPRLWSKPEKFEPERFVSGGEEADITGVSGVKMVPFGVGRRICPGLNMATVHIHLMIGRMVQEFEWSGYPEGKEIDFTGKMEFTVVMKESLRATIKPRE